jgi:hypothetical protein
LSQISLNTVMAEVSGCLPWRMIGWHFFLAPVHLGFHAMFAPEGDSCPRKAESKDAKDTKDVKDEEPEFRPSVLSLMSLSSFASLSWLFCRFQAL